MKMFGQCLIFAYLGLCSILLLCEQVKIGEDGVLVKHFQSSQGVILMEG